MVRKLIVIGAMGLWLAPVASAQVLEETDVMEADEVLPAESNSDCFDAAGNLINDDCVGTTPGAAGERVTDGAIVFWEEVDESPSQGVDPEDRRQTGAEAFGWDAGKRAR